MKTAKWVNFRVNRRSPVLNLGALSPGRVQVFGYAERLHLAVQALDTLQKKGTRVLPDSVSCSSFLFIFLSVGLS